MNDMDILDDIGVSKLSAKVNYSFKNYNYHKYDSLYPWWIRQAL